MLSGESERTHVHNADLPPAPLTLEGSAVLHQMFRLDRRSWRAQPEQLRKAMMDEAWELLERWQQQGSEHSSALYQLLGHKADLMLLHFRPDMEGLARAQLEVDRLRLADFLVPVASFLSVVELGLYESSCKLYSSLLQNGIQPGSEAWQRQVEETLAHHRKAMAPRLHPCIPSSRFVCFYPMNRRRQTGANWYATPILERNRMMREHGETGRRFADKVKQIVTGSVGLDDWEWGVTLFSDDPLAFKHLVYEMRFDEASYRYAEFGPFYVGLRLDSPQLLSSLLTP